MIHTRTRLAAMLVTICAIAGLGCAKFVDVRKTDLLAKTVVRRIAILPFSRDLYVKRAGKGSDAALMCLYDHKGFPNTRVSDVALAEVTAIFTQQLLMRGGYAFVGPGEVEALVRKQHLDPQALEPPAFFGAIGAGLGVDAVLAGNVFRYQERHGSAYGAERPASVALDFHLIDARTGKMLWEASYSETQSTLSDNVGGIGTFVQRGAAFLTANQLASWAAEQILEKFPEPREGKRSTVKILPPGTHDAGSAP